MKFNSFFILVLSSLISLSCVSKKKFEARLLSHENERQEYESRIAQLDQQIIWKNQQIDTLTLMYTHTSGANEALVKTQDKLLDRIDEVQAVLDAERKDKSSTTKNLNEVVREKELLILEKEAQINQVKNTIDEFEENQKKLLTEFSSELEQLFADKQSVNFVNNEIRISLDEDLLFRPTQARIRTAGIQNLKKMAEFMNKYPTLKLYVVGNTDNKKAKNFKDNWDYSVIRASNVVKVLTDEYQVSPSRVIAAGKGEFAPKSSNETREGQIANRRIDFVILPRFDRLIKEVKKNLE